ncbi:hypothetical protein CBL_11527 [Carabus blaptoides fortunei]
MDRSRQFLMELKTISEAISSDSTDKSHHRQQQPTTRHTVYLLGKIRLALVNNLLSIYLPTTGIAASECRTTETEYVRGDRVSIENTKSTSDFMFRIYTSIYSNSLPPSSQSFLILSEMEV